MELAPYQGWSTFFLLSALRDNIKQEGRVGRCSTLDSFDMLPFARERVPRELYSRGGENACVKSGLPRWNFHLGDARELLKPQHHREENKGNKEGGGGEKGGKARCSLCWDYIFVDAAHSWEFGAWYTWALLEQQFLIRRHEQCCSSTDGGGGGSKARSSRRMHGSIHDAWMQDWGNYAGQMDEMRRPLEWFSRLGAYGWLSRWFTVSSVRDKALHAQVQLVRNSAGILQGDEGRKIVGSDTNSMHFFDLLDILTVVLK